MIDIISSDGGSELAADEAPPRDPRVARHLAGDRTHQGGSACG